MREPVHFRILHSSPSGARLGMFQRGNLAVFTPAFMPCASYAAVRACSPCDLWSAGLRILVCNAFHLSQRPGDETIARLGGLHQFMSWPGLIATDSGGFQAFSLASLEDASEQGVEITSRIDGRRVLVTPELMAAVQRNLGADFVVALDLCAPYPVSREGADRAVELTAQWGRRAIQAHADSPQLLFGVVQGSVFDDLRRKSAQLMAEAGFQAFGIGGLSVGESRDEMLRALAVSLEELPPEAPKWLMGVGTPRDIADAAAMGVDLFDCVLPTRMARHGSAITWHGPVKLDRAEMRTDERPIDDTCPCPTCRLYSRAYLHHLLREGEAAAWRLVTLHNVFFYARLMERIRDAIRADALPKLRRELPAWTERDREGDR